IVILCIATFALATVIAWAVFDAMPHLEDEHANLFQADVFAAGRVTVEVPRDVDSFFVPFVINTAEGKRFGKYPPGYPLLLALGAAVGRPWLINALAAALGVLGTYLLGRDLFDRDAGLLGAALVAISPMYLLLAGTLLAHSTSVATLMFFAWAFVRARRPAEPHGMRFGVAAGLLLGWAAIIRPWTALAVALPFMLLGLWDVLRSRGRALPLYIIMACAAALVCLIQLWFNLAATGSATTNTYRMWWNYDTVGFGPGHGRSEVGHTLSDGFRNLKLDLAEFPAALFGWPEPRGFVLAGIPIALGLLWPALQRNGAAQPRAPAASFVSGIYKEWALLLPAVALVVAQMAYWARGSSLYGPRYYAEAIPFLAIIAARGLIKFAAGPWRRRAIKLALPALVAWSVVFTIESRTLKGRSLFDIDRHDINTIAAAAPRNALVFVAGDYWTSYANLSWLNAPTLDSTIIFAKDRGPNLNDQVIRDYPGRTVYYYKRDRNPALSGPLPPPH
ncbi:MAG: glycosyltransferase family 39 protein, partial [Roseiflexaceae bacterium]